MQGDWDRSLPERDLDRSTTGSPPIIPMMMTVTHRPTGVSVEATAQRFSTARRVADRLLREALNLDPEGPVIEADVGSGIRLYLAPSGAVTWGRGPTDDSGRVDSAAITVLIERTNRLEAVLRSAALHEGDCAVMMVIRHNSMGTTYMHPMPCDCWLSR